MLKGVNTIDDLPIVKDLRLEAYFQELSADSLYPSAGSSAAMTAAHAAALFTMACRVNLRKIEEKSHEVKEDNSRKEFWQNTLQHATLLLEQALALAQEDGFAIKDYIEGVPRGVEKVTTIPLEIASCAGKIAALIARAFPESYAPVQADAKCALCLAEGGKKAALAIARANLPLHSQDKQRGYIEQISGLEQG